MSKSPSYCQIKFIMVCIITIGLCGCSNSSVKTNQWIPKDSVIPSVNSIDSLEENKTVVSDNCDSDNFSVGGFNFSYKNELIDPNTFLSDFSTEKSYDESDRLLRFSMPVYFYADNGLLCVNSNVHVDISNNRAWYELVYLVLPDKYYSEEYELETYFDECMVVVADDLDIAISNIVDDFATILMYQEIALNCSPGRVWTVYGTFVDAESVLGAEYSKSFSSTSIDNSVAVVPGERYRFSLYSSWFSDVATFVFFNDSDNIISYYSTGSSTYIKDQYIVVPDNATKMVFSLYSNQEYKIEREIAVNAPIIADNVKTDYYQNSLDIWLKKQSESQKKYNGVYKLDKAYISFVIDDTRPDIDEIADIFEKHNLPLCIAAVHENLLFPASKGDETRLQVCERVVKNGGEILSHYATPITDAEINDYDELLKHFFCEKKSLEYYGFDINGIIMSGGIGQLTNNTILDMFARNFYDYGDLYGLTERGEPYYHPRTLLMNHISTFEEEIADAVKDKKWSVYYLHDQNEVSLETLDALLTYLEQYSEEELEVVTYKSLYDTMWK